MLAFESLTPQELLKEVAEYIRMEAVRADLTVTLLDRQPRLTRAETIQRARYESTVAVLRRIANDLEGAGIIPANSMLRTRSMPAGELIASTPAAPDTNPDYDDVAAQPED